MSRTVYEMLIKDIPNHDSKMEVLELLFKHNLAKGDVSSITYNFKVQVYSKSSLVVVSAHGIPLQGGSDSLGVLANKTYTYNEFIELVNGELFGALYGN